MTTFALPTTSAPVLLPGIRGVLAHAARLLAPLRVGRCEVLREVETLDDPFGMAARPVREVAFTVPCRVREAWQPPYDRALGGHQTGPVTAWLVMLPKSDALGRPVEIRSTDRLRVVQDAASNPEGPATELEVISVYPDRTYGVERRVLCQQVGVAEARD